METRKVLEMGGGTMLISLPKAWARRNQIVKGSSILVDEISPRKLIVSPLPGEERSGKTVVIEYPKEYPAYLINDVTGAYLMGSNIIKIMGRKMITSEDRERIKSSMRRLVGLEIMDEDSKSMTLQFLPEPSTLDPEKIVRRMASLTKGMLRDTMEAVTSEDSKMLSLITERDDEVDRLYFLLVRAIRTATMDPEVAERYNPTPVECLDFRVLASILESLGDAISELSQMSSELFGLQKVKGASDVFTLLEKMEDLSIRMFLNRKTGQSRKGYLEIDAMQHQVNDLSRRVAQPKTMPARAAVDLLSMLERIAKTFVDISDLALPT